MMIRARPPSIKEAKNRARIDGRRRPGVDLKLLKISPEEIDFALAAERRWWVRNRLIAIRTVLNGGTEEQAAKLANVSCQSVGRWLRHVRQSGFTALVYDGRIEPRGEKMKPDEIRTLRETIGILLKGKPSREERLRLLAVEAVLGGNPLHRLATEAGVKPTTLEHWLTAARWHGAGALLRGGRHKPHRGG